MARFGTPQLYMTSIHGFLGLECRGRQIRHSALPTRAGGRCWPQSAAGQPVGLCMLLELQRWGGEYFETWKLGLYVRYLYFFDYSPNSNSGTDDLIYYESLKYTVFCHLVFSSQNYPNQRDYPTKGTAFYG